MHNFKPGDLALIVKCQLRPELVGMCVQLVLQLEKGELTELEGCDFVARFDNSWIIRGSGLKCRRRGELRDSNTGICAIARDCLMPLRGDEQTAPAKREELTV